MGADRPSGASPAVAVVDDDQRIRATLRRALQLEGYDVLEGSDGLDGEALAGRGEPIEISVAAVGREAHVRMRDRGPGIPAALRETVFERFYRAPEARAQPGSGLGLSIVDYAARSHNGSASVIDTDGAGTTVELRRPSAELDSGGRRIPAPPTGFEPVPPA